MYRYMLKCEKAKQSKLIRYSKFICNRILKKLSKLNINTPKLILNTELQTESNINFNEGCLSTTGLKVCLTEKGMTKSKKINFIKKYFKYSKKIAKIGPFYILSSRESSWFKRYYSHRLNSNDVVMISTYIPKKV